MEIIPTGIDGSRNQSEKKRQKRSCTASAGEATYADGKIIPFSKEVESGLIGSILQSPADAFQDLIPLGLLDIHFHDKVLREIYRSALTMFSDGKEINHATLGNLLQRHPDEDIRKVATYAYIFELERSSPPASDVKSSYPILEEFLIKRQILEVADKFRELGFSRNALSRKIFAPLGGMISEYSNRISPEQNEIIDAADLFDDPPQTPTELVQGLLHKASKLVLGGGSKSYKTWTLIYLALCVSHGIPWLGCNTERARVLYLNFELHPAFFARRLAKVTRALGIATLEHGWIDVMHLRGQNSAHDVIIPRIQKQAKERGYGLIIPDPIYKMYGNLVENNTGDMAKLMNALEVLACNTGAAVAFGAHFSKGNQAGKESIDRMSGSGVFARDPDTILTFTKHEEEGAYTVEPILRNFPPMHPFVVRWDSPLFVPATGLDPLKLHKVNRGRPRDYIEEDLLKVLGDSKMTTGEWEKAAFKAGIKSATFGRLKKNIIPTLGKDGDKWYQKSQKPI